MKRDLWLLGIGLGLMGYPLSAQYVHIIQEGDTVTKPTHLIQLVYEEDEADWVVAITVDVQEAERQEGFWFLTSNPKRADFIVKLVREPIQADKKVYLTEREWRIRVDY